MGKANQYSIIKLIIFKTLLKLAITENQSGNNLYTQAQNAAGQNTNPATTLVGTAPSYINICNAKTAYVHPFKNDLGAEAGLKASLLQIMLPTAPGMRVAAGLQALLLKTWAAELSGWYIGQEGEGLLLFKNMGAMNVFLSKQLFHKKATIKAGVRAVFKTQEFHGFARYSDVDIRISNIRDSRRFNLSFTYKFGKANIAPVRNRKSGSGDEQNRVKTGGN